MEYKVVTETNSHTRDELEVYENKYYSMPFFNPVDALLFVMDQQDLNRQDIEKYLGEESCQ